MIVIDIKISSGIFYSMSLIAYLSIDLLFLYYVDITIIFVVIVGLRNLSDFFSVALLQSIDLLAFLAANLYFNLTWSDIQADAILNSGMATVKCSYGAFPPAGSSYTLLCTTHVNDCSIDCVFFFIK